MKTLLSVFFTCCIYVTYSQQQYTKPLRHFMQMTTPSSKETQYGNNPKAGHYVKADDAKIYYEVYGKGKPIVILHGGIFGSTYEMYRFIDSLKKTNLVIAVSTRGHGKSALGNKPITLEQKANDVVAAINAVTKDSVIILGFSDGAYAGYKIASMYPARVKKLVAIGATELSPGLRNFKFDVKQALALDSVYWKQQNKLTPEPERLQEMFTQLGNMYNGLTLDSSFFQMIQCPTLVMAGEKDLQNPPARVLSTAKMISSHQIGIIPNTGHGVFLENFDAVWACIIPFLKK
ncbi:MAG: alpha/beta hydrolase [Bacteroidetes bacterium]|nr:alpha/beta hydrolase [Bacteroidota bacterium]